MKRLITLLIPLLICAGTSWGQSAIIGTGTSTTNGSNADPVDRSYNYAHFQMVYTAAELSAAGMPADALINSLGFSISESAVSLANYTISMGHTSQATANPYISTGLTIVKTAFTYTPVVQTAGNFDMIAFTTNFQWDGSSNIVVNTCTGSNPYETPYGGLRYTPATSGAVRYIWNERFKQLCNSYLFNNGERRPNIRFDYTAIPCSGIPTPGNTISSANPVCADVNFTLSLQNFTSGVGVTYQWQSSVTGEDPWTNAGISPSTYTTSQTTATYYRCQVTCEGNTGTSNPVQVTMTSWFNCYCACASSVSSYEFIDSIVATGGINNTGTGPSTYSDFTAYSSTIQQGATMTINVSGGTPWYDNDAAYVFIDFNQDSDFSDAGELAGTGTGGESPYSISFLIPLSATLGSTRMRIKFGDTLCCSLPPMTDDPCQTGYNYGETEDYTVNIEPPPDYPVFSATPASKNYGECPLFNFSPDMYTQTFTVQNIGAEGNLTITAVFLTGGDDSDFILTDTNTYPVNLGTFATMQFAVKFYPLTVGAKATTLRIQSSAKTEHDIPLNGNGIVYPPQNFSGVTTIIHTNDLHWDPLPEGEIRYDNGNLTDWYWVNNPTTATDYSFTRFTAPVDGNLDYVSLFSLEGPDWSEILVCPESGTTNTPDLFNPIATFTDIPVNSNTGEWLILQLLPSGALTSGTDFFLVTHWPAGSNWGPVVGTDATVNSGRCGWSDNGTTWNTFSMTFIMRAYMSTSEGENYSLVSGDPDPSLASLPVKTLSPGKEPMKGHSEEAARMTVPGIYKKGGNRDLLNYTLLRGLSPATLTDYVTGITATNYIDFDVDPLTTYFYGIIAVYSGNQLSDTSNVISLTTLEACFTPWNQTTTDITTTSAVLNWSYGDPPPESFFDIFWGEKGFDPATGGTLVSGVSSGVTLTPLEDGTSYDWYSRANCGFYKPKKENFWIELYEAGEIGGLSGGGPVDDPGEDGMFHFYQDWEVPWHNVWWYNGPVDTNRMKIIRMGFWVQRINQEAPADITYVVNWSTPGWQGPGFPTSNPNDTGYIERSPVSEPVQVLPTDPEDPNGQWVELYYVIPDYNPEWVSVDFWGQNVRIINGLTPPPDTSLLLSWWLTDQQPGGILVHECLPKPAGHTSEWVGPVNFSTNCNPADLPYCESFFDIWPTCWRQGHLHIHIVPAGGSMQLQWQVVRPLKCTLMMYNPSENRGLQVRHLPCLRMVQHLPLSIFMMTMVQGLLSVSGTATTADQPGPPDGRMHQVEAISVRKR